MVLVVLPQCSLRKENKLSSDNQAAYRSQKTTKKEEKVLRGLHVFKEAAAERKTSRYDEYESNGPAWYRGYSLEDLKKYCARYEKDGNYELVVKYLDRIIKLSDDQQEIKSLRIKLSDALFNLGEYERAAVTYSIYAELYPGCPEAIYADYKSIVASSKLILASDRDQAATIQTIKRARDFLISVAENPTEFDEQVRELLKKALRILFKSEVLTFYHYLNNAYYIRDEKYVAAEGRVTYIREKFLNSADQYSYLPEIEPDVIVLECELAAARQDFELQKQKTADLAQRYPGHTEKQRKQSHKKRPDFTQKF
jgi:outer membrane protein assembly factor BamD (BamD/ComL family)